jgi:hypothetical protein
MPNDVVSTATSARRPYVVDSERWPVLYIRPPSSLEYEPATLAGYFEALDAVIARRKLCGVLLDMRGFFACDQAVWVIQEWVAQRDQAIRAIVLAMAVLVSTEADRERVVSAFWGLADGFHAQIFTDREAAAVWLLTEHARHESTSYV